MFLKFLLALSIALPLVAQDDLMTHARKLSADSLGIDSHIDTIQHVLEAHADLTQNLPYAHVDIPKLHEGGMKAPFFALWVPVFYPGPEAVRRTLDLRDAMQRVLDAHPDQIELATTAADIQRIVKSGKISAFLAIEGGHQIDDDLAVLRTYYRLGIRAMTLTHFKNNNWADSSTDKPAHNGLTPFGKDVVREMNRLGMIVDVSHVSDKTFYDAIAVSTKPVILSHSSVRAISEIPRNVTDDMLRALAKNGGVVGINFGEGFINNKDAAALNASISNLSSGPADMTAKSLDAYAHKEYQDQIAGQHKPAATIEDVVAHIDHVVKVAGIDHIGIGSDFDGITAPPQGLENVSKMPYLVAALIKHGYSDRDIKKILGENYLRVIQQVTGK
jgi:membrane dipeptidase